MHYDLSTFAKKLDVALVLKVPVSVIAVKLVATETWTEPKPVSAC